MKYVRITPRNRSLYQERLAALEKKARYPLGQDTFTLDHGRDYFAFFDRLGHVEYRAALDGDRVVAVGCGILRRVPKRVWYLGDLKVDPAYRGQRIPLRMLSRAFLLNYLRCPRGYAISMNPPSGENRVVRLLQKFRWARLSVPAFLEIYSLDDARMRQLAPLVAEHRGPISYLSLAGKKDLILGSTGKPLPILHVQWGPCGEKGYAEPRDGHGHMLCAPAGDALANALAERGVAPTATASILQHRMRWSDWRFVLTSDI